MAVKSRTLTIMFIDVKGYTSYTARRTREEIQQFIKEITSFVSAHVEKRNGKIIKTLGDGFLITFESATDAVICGIEIQKGIEFRNENISERSRKIRLKIGISSGDVNIAEDGDVFGDAVNVAARIQQFSPLNAVLISESTNLLINKPEVDSLYLGAHRLKNIFKKVKLYGVYKEPLKEDKTQTTKSKIYPPPSQKGEKDFFPLLKGTLIVLIIAGIISIFYPDLKRYINTLKDKYFKVFMKRPPPHLKQFIKKRLPSRHQQLTSCRIKGIISSQPPSVMIGKKTYYVGDIVCGSKIVKIYSDKVVAIHNHRIHSYFVGQVVGSVGRN